MEANYTAIPDDRPLTKQEIDLVRWMLEPGAPRAVEYIAQLERARVIARCYCGCASIDFAVEGLPRPISGNMQILADFEYGDAVRLCGAFVFAKEGVLSGLEVCGYAVDAPRLLPAVHELRPLLGAQ
jgi:hypothetical protein